MSMFRARLSGCALLAALALPAFAQTDAASTRDPAALLQSAKKATGGAAWDAFRTQHSEVRIATGGMSGKAERWVDMVGGRSLVKYSVGPMTGAAGFDGRAAWSQDGNGQARPEISTEPRSVLTFALPRP